MSAAKGWPQKRRESMGISDTGPGCLPTVVYAVYDDAAVEIVAVEVEHGGYCGAPSVSVKLPATVFDFPSTMKTAIETLRCKLLAMPDRGLGQLTAENAAYIRAEYYPDAAPTTGGN